MTKCYLDPSALPALGLGGAYQAWAATPTVGGLSTDKPAPMDGNGKAASDSAAAVAVAEIYCGNAVSSAAASTLSIAGSSTGAIGGSLTGSALATDIVTKINAGANNVSTTVTPCTLTMANWCWARVKPGDTSRVQIYTRCAGSDLNFASNSLVAITQYGTWTTGFSGGDITQFAGGADGPWAYIINSAAAFGKAVGAYGLRASAPPTPYNPTLAPSGSTPGDFIEVRCARSGSPITLTVSVSAALNIQCPAYRHFIFDSTGTTWSGDAGQFTLAISQSTANNVNLYGPPSATASVIRESAKSYQGFRIFYTGVTGGSCYITPASTYGNIVSIIHDNVLLEEENSVSVIAYYASGAIKNTIISKNLSCLFKSGHSPIIANASSVIYYQYFQLINPTLNWSGLSADVPSLVDFGGMSVNTTMVCEVIGGTVNAGAWMVANCIRASSVGNGARFSFDISGVRSPSFGLNAGSHISNENTICEWIDRGPDKGFRYDNMAVNVDWLPNNATPYPSLRTVTPTGKGKSIRVGVFTTTGTGGAPSGGVGNDVLPCPINLEVFNRKETAIRAITFDVMVESSFLSGSYPLSKAHFGFLIRYKDGGGNTYFESTLEPGHKLDENNGSALDASSETWLNIPSGFVAKKINYQTLNAVGQNTTVSARLVIAGTTNGNTSMYFEPTPVLT